MIVSTKPGADKDLPEILYQKVPFKSMVILTVVTPFGFQTAPHSGLSIFFWFGFEQGTHISQTPFILPKQLAILNDPITFQISLL